MAPAAGFRELNKAFRGAAVQVLPQAPDNAANGHLGLARRVKIFLRFWNSGAGYKVSSEDYAANSLYLLEFLYKKCCAEKISCADSTHKCNAIGGEGMS